MLMVPEILMPQVRANLNDTYICIDSTVSISPECDQEL